MKYYVYILYSKSLDKHYVGMSEFSFKRLRQHKNGQTQWTSLASDWEKVWQVKCINSTDARVLEKKIKSRGAKRYLSNI